MAWTRTIYAQFELLAGKSAPHDFLQLIIYKAMTFSDEIEKIDTVRAYHVCRLKSCPAILDLDSICFRVVLFVRVSLYLALIPDGFLQDYFVEVDVVMDASTPLWKAHDISQQLQDKIEVLPNVERAFVHVDHETTHRPVSALMVSLAYLSPISHRSIGNMSNQPMFSLYHDDVTKDDLRLC